MAKLRLPLRPWLPLFILPTLTLLLRDGMPPWIFMWALAASIFAGCKWLVYCEGIAHVEAPLHQRIGFLLLWPGMDVRTFLRGPKPARPSSREWAAQEIVEGSKLARAFCAFVAVFWGLRLIVQFFVFDARPILTNWFLKAGYHGLTVLFIALVVIFSWAALR